MQTLRDIRFSGSKETAIRLIVKVNKKKQTEHA